MSQAQFSEQWGSSPTAAIVAGIILTKVRHFQALAQQEKRTSKDFEYGARQEAG
jgi:hypothetical protein